VETIRSVIRPSSEELHGLDWDLNVGAEAEPVPTHVLDRWRRNGAHSLKIPNFYLMSDTQFFPVYKRPLFANFLL